MSVLITMTFDNEQIWVDDAQNTWVDDAQNVFVDTDQTIIRVSDEDLPIEHFWEGSVIDFDPISFNPSTNHGGYCKMEYGSFTLKSSAFAGVGLTIPPRMFQVLIQYTPDTESNAETLIQGTAFRTKFDRNGSVYDVYGPNYTQEFLVKIDDYNGDTIAIPRALGQVDYRHCIRLPDSGGYPVYHNGYLSGTKGVDWTVEDDGINISANAIDDGGGFFHLTASAAGEVTVSGVGEIETLDDLFTWGASELGLTYDNALISNKTLSKWIDSQGTLISYLDDIAASCCHIFYIKAGELVIVSMDTANGSRSVDEYDFYPSSYEDDTPVSTLTFDWGYRGVNVDGLDHHIADYDDSETVASAYSFGSDEDIEIYNTVNKATIRSRLETILDYLNKERARLKMKLTSGLPLPGEQITSVDESTHSPTTFRFFARQLVYDFLERTVTVDGDGVIQ